MTVLEKLLSWLETFPLWDGMVQTDSLPAQPGCYGVFPQGIRELGRREDVLGRVQADNRLTVLLHRIIPGEDDRQADAQWLLALQDWVQQQSMAGLAPRLGDAPHRQRIRAEDGRLKNPAQTATGRYTVKITADYVTMIDNSLPSHDFP